MEYDLHDTAARRDQLLASEVEFSVQRLVAQCDAYRARIRELEQPATQSTVHALLADPHVNAGNAYIRFEAPDGDLQLIGVNPEWGQWWCMPEQVVKADDYADPVRWMPTQWVLRALGEVVPAAVYRKPVDILEDSPLKGAA